jgi:hypothetical protein
VESFAGPELECVFALHGTGMLCRTLPPQLHPEALSASKSHAGCDTLVVKHSKPIGKIVVYGLNCVKFE